MKKFLILCISTSSIYGASSSSQQSMVLTAPSQVMPQPGIAASSTSTTYSAESYFSQRINQFNSRLENRFHPIMHGCAESKKNKGLLEIPRELWHEAVQFYRLLRNAQWNDSLNQIWHIAQLPVVVISGQAGIMWLAHRQDWTSRNAVWALDRLLSFWRPAIQQPPAQQGQASQHAMHNEAEVLSFWNQIEMCPEGLHQCRKLSARSLLVLSGISNFVNNIEFYRQERGHDFFEPESVNRVANILDGVINRVFDINLQSALNNQVCDDRGLESTWKLIQALTAIPTVTHDIAAAWSRNREEIDRLLSGLPPETQADLFNYMNALVEQAADPTRGHRAGDTGIQLILKGPSGSGKTYIALQIMRLLGFPVITCTFEELFDRPSQAPIESLVEKCRLSPIEQKILQLVVHPDTQRLQSVSPLNPIFFIDELDGDRISSISELKDKLDQFKRLLLPSLGLMLPSFLNCIFTTNNLNLISDPALVGRFISVLIPAMHMEQKIQILVDQFQLRLANNPELEQSLDGTSQDLMAEYAKYDPDINIRILLGNLDIVIAHFKTKLLRNTDMLHRLPPAQRQRDKAETFAEFLKRRFGEIKHTDQCTSQSYRTPGGKGPAIRRKKPALRDSSKKHAKKSTYLSYGSSEGNQSAGHAASAVYDYSSGDDLPEDSTSGCSSDY